MKKLPLLPLFTLLLTTLACQTVFPSAGLSSGEFEGFYTSGFEVASFVPCEMIGDPNQGAGYWLTGTPEFIEQYTALVKSSGRDPISGYFPVYVRFTGELSPPGNYGHLGIYEREVTVTELLEISVDGQCK